MLDRRDDHQWVVSSLVGAVILGATFFLKFKVGLNDTPYSFGLVIGAGLVSPNIIKGLIVKWRQKSE